MHIRAGHREYSPLKHHYKGLFVIKINLCELYTIEFIKTSIRAQNG